MWLTVPLSGLFAVCALHGEEDAVVRLLGRTGHPLLGGSWHWPPHLPPLLGKATFSVTRQQVARHFPTTVTHLPVHVYDRAETQAHWMMVVQ